MVLKVVYMLLYSSPYDGLKAENCWGSQTICMYDQETGNKLILDRELSLGSRLGILIPKCDPPVPRPKHSFFLKKIR